MVADLTTEHHYMAKLYRLACDISTFSSRRGNPSFVVEVREANWVVCTAFRLLCRSAIGLCHWNFTIYAVVEST